MAIQNSSEPRPVSANSTSGKVTHANYRGDRWVYDIASEMGPLVVKGTSLGKSYVEGERVLITWDVESVNILDQLQRVNP
jgi:hypothetical protein